MSHLFVRTDENEVAFAVTDAFIFSIAVSFLLEYGSFEHALAAHVINNFILTINDENRFMERLLVR